MTADVGIAERAERLVAVLVATGLVGLRRARGRAQPSSLVGCSRSRACAPSSSGCVEVRRQALVRAAVTAP